MHRTEHRGQKTKDSYIYVTEERRQKTKELPFSTGSFPQTLSKGQNPSSLGAGQENFFFILIIIHKYVVFMDVFIYSFMEQTPFCSHFGHTAPKVEIRQYVVQLPLPWMPHVGHFCTLGASPEQMVPQTTNNGKKLLPDQSGLRTPSISKLKRGTLRGACLLRRSTPMCHFLTQDLFIRM